MSPLRSLITGAGLALLALAAPIRADEPEGTAAVFIIDESAKFASMGGECVEYTKDAVPGSNKRLLTFAKGVPGSVVVIAAFEAGKDQLHRRLAPVVVEHSKTAKAIHFPTEDASIVWPFSSDVTADLFVLICDENDPILPTLRKNIASLRSALEGRQEDAVLLQSVALRTRIATLMRNRTSDSFDARVAPSSIAAVRRGLKSLDHEWSDDSHPVPFSKGNPGLLLFKIGSRD